MKRNDHQSLFAVLGAILLLGVCLSAGAAPVSSAFTYQGRLNTDGSGANGIYDFQFQLFGEAADGTALAGPLNIAAVPVSNGLFQVTLDFGPVAFTGDARWLEIAVKNNLTSDPLQLLSPRQAITAAPHALVANALAGAVSAMQVTGTLSSASLAGSYDNALNLSNPANLIAGDGSSLLFGGFSYTNLPFYWSLTGNAGTTPALHFLGTLDAQPLELRVDGQPALRLEPATSPALGAMPNIIGGGGNSSLAAGNFGVTISGGGSHRAEDQSYFSTISGGLSNSLASGASYSVIGGGNANALGTNASFGVISGGESNQANAPYSTVAGGQLNMAAGTNSFASGYGCLASGNYAIAVGYNTVASGEYSTAIGPNATATAHDAIAMGTGATANGLYSRASGVASTADGLASTAMGDFTYAGGESSTAMGKSTTASALASTAMGRESEASGSSSTAMGWRTLASGPMSTAMGWLTTASGLNATAMGFGTTASGDYSTALGRHAQATNDGTFVWADADDTDFSSTGTNQFLVRASGGVGINTDSPQFALHVNGDAGKPGGGAWSVASDARLKKDIRPLEQALARLLQLRGVTFEYKDPKAIHELSGQQTGMIAQEVEKVFPEWVETAPDGMRRLSIRGFEALTVEALRDLRAEKDEQIHARDAQITALEKRLAALEERMASGTSSGSVQSTR